MRKLYRQLMILIAIIFLQNIHVIADENIEGDKKTGDSYQQIIILKNDTSIHDGKTGSFENCGNAVLTQGGLKITANCLIGKKREDGTYVYITAIGTPATLTKIDEDKNETLEASANKIEYFVPKKKFIMTDKADLKLSQKRNTHKEAGSIQVNADSIILDDANPSNKIISATGQPLEIEMVKSGVAELKAKAKSLTYNTGTSDLKLSDDVVATLALGQITAGIFEYNSKTKISSFKKSNDEQIEIIQTRKQPK